MFGVDNNGLCPVDDKRTRCLFRSGWRWGEWFDSDRVHKRTTTFGRGRRRRGQSLLGRRLGSEKVQQGRLLRCRLLVLFAWHDDDDDTTVVVALPVNDRQMNCFAGQLSDNVGLFLCDFWLAPTK